MKTIYNNEYKLLIEKLRNLRIEKRLTQAELAEKLGVDQTYISKIEGLQRRVDVIELRKICNAMQTSLLKFLKNFEDNIK